ncbi:MAG: hypothetical protein QXS16_05150 [Pyrobaculum sp.]
MLIRCIITIDISYNIDDVRSRATLPDIVDSFLHWVEPVATIREENDKAGGKAWKKYGGKGEFKRTGLSSIKSYRLPRV